MYGPHLDLNLIIKTEADNILQDTGLLGILALYGTPSITGSYTLGLMTWRDLDIYLQVDNFSESKFFELGGRLCTVLTPVKMSFRNELVAKTKGHPSGLYWGIYLGNERAGAWKIDIWAVRPPECQRLVQYCTDIQQKLTTESVSKILDIKSQCWNDPEYMRSYGSADIYHAVLENNITTIQGFKNYLKANMKDG